MVFIYSGENHQFHIYNGEFDEQSIWNEIFQNIVSFFSRSPICKYFLKMLIFCVIFVSHVGKIWQIFHVCFHFFGIFFWWKSQQITFFFCSFFTWKKNYMSVKLKKTSSEKVIFFCKIYRHVRHSLILICTLMSSMGKIDQHFEKMI